MRIRGTGAAISVLVLWGCGGGGGGGGEPEATQVEQKPAGPPPIVGVLDESFGVGGIVAYDGPEHGDDRGNAILRDAQGRILVAGSTWSMLDSYDVALWRFNDNGAPDPDFGDGGVATTHHEELSEIGLGMALDHQERIVVVGYQWSKGHKSMMIWRFNPDGHIDTTFYGGVGYRFHNIDKNEPSFDSGASVAIDDTDRIVVAGRSTLNGIHRMVLWRFNSDGSLDTSFGDEGEAPEKKGFAVFQPLDFSHSEGKSLALDSGGRIVVAGRCRIGESEPMILWRYLSDGILDLSFGGIAGGPVGYATFDLGPDTHCVGSAIKIDPQGKLLVAGRMFETVDGQDTLSVMLWRYQPNGRPDSTFGAAKYDDGTSKGYTRANTGNANSLVLDLEGRIVVAGRTSPDEASGDLLVARFHPDGEVDRGFGDIDPEVPTERKGYLTHERGLVEGGEDQGADLALDGEGRILVAGASDGAGTGIHLDMLVWRFR